MNQLQSNTCVIPELCRPTESFSTTLKDPAGVKVAAESIPLSPCVIVLRVSMEVMFLQTHQACACRLVT